MVRALLNGERNGSPLQVLALVALVALLAGSFALTFAYRGQLIGLKHVIYGRCQQRLAYDQANHTSIGADVRLDKVTLRLNAKERPQVRELIHAFPRPERPLLRQVQRDDLRALRAALAEKQRAFAQGVIGNCSKFH